LAQEQDFAGETEKTVRNHDLGTLDQEFQWSSEMKSRTSRA
jgi:hypothetical protein